MDGHNSTSSKDTQPFSACIVYCQFLLFNFCSFSALFNSVLLFDYSVFELFRVFSVLILELYSRYFNPTLQQPSGSQLTSYSRQHHLCLSIESERPITIIDIEGYPEPISPYGLSRRRDIYFVIGLQSPFKDCSITLSLVKLTR